jgi:hypothetical protein
MQRRAAAIYVIFFVVVAIGAYSVIAVAEEPQVSVEGQTFSGSTNTSIGNETYTINVSSGSGEVSTVNRSARFTASLANNSTLRLVNGTYRPVPNGSGGGGGTTTGGASPTGGGATSTPGTAGTSVPSGGAAGGGSQAPRLRVVIANATNASGGNASAGNASGGNASGGNASRANVTTFTLREVLNVNALLRDDPSVADVTLTGANGTQYVRYRNGSTAPLDTYLPPVSTRNVSVGEEFPYKGNLTAVSRVNSSAATLAWQGTLTNTQEFEEGQNVTLGNTTYVAHFRTNSTVVLSQNVAAYQEEQQQVTDFHNRILGLWGVVIISLFAAILIAGLAYLPVRG